MPRDPRASLWDARRAAELIGTFVAGRTFGDYERDPLLRSGVERQFEIIGEAMNQLSRTSPEFAARIPDLARIVAFRNLLIHGYASIDDRIVWEAATERVDPLIAVIDGLLSSPS